LDVLEDGDHRGFKQAESVMTCCHSRGWLEYGQAFRGLFQPGLLVPSVSNLDNARQATVVVGPLQVCLFAMVESAEAHNQVRFTTSGVFEDCQTQEYNVEVPKQNV
jgi:hypothetical protein